MKSVLYVFIAMIFLACGNTRKTKTSDSTNSPVQLKDRVEVLYFHGKQRCQTCNAIEDLAKEVVDTLFARELKEGKVVYKVIDISKKENDSIANKYEVTWSSLFINKWKDGQETPANMTDFAFTNVLASPALFKEGIKKKITEQLE